MQLHRTASPLTRDERNKLNENWGKIERNYYNVVENISEEAFDKVVDSAKLDWLHPVDTFDSIETTYRNATEGKTVMVRDTGKVYRKNSDGEWIEIQDIDPTVINEVDSRLSTMLEEMYEELSNDIGPLSDLPTNDKSSIVKSITEVNEKIPYLNLKDYGAVGDYDPITDTGTDDTIAIQAAIDDASAKGIPLCGEFGKTYLITSITLKPNVYKFKGVTFRTTGLLSGNVYVVNCQNDVEFDKLTVTVPNGSTAERIVGIRSNSDIGKVVVMADTQHAMSNDLIDGAVVVDGINTNIKRITTVNLDYGVTFYNIQECDIEEVRNISFVRGLYIRKTKDSQITKLFTKTRSPNAGQNPGHNSLLIEECESLRMINCHLQDAGEHGVRIGGIRDGLYKQGDLWFGSIVTRRTGQCGFKAFTADGTFIERLQVDSLLTIDCAYGSIPGTNEDGLYLSGVRESNIGKFRCIKDGNGVSAYRGAYISNVFKVTINDADIWDTASTGITISDADGLVNDLIVNKTNIRNVKNEGILVDHAIQTLRDVVFKGVYIRGFGSTYYGVKVNAKIISQPVIFSGFVGLNGQLGKFNANIVNNYLIDDLREIRVS